MKAALWSIYANKGEMCTAGSRLLLHADIHDRFVEELAGRASKLRLGDPLDPRTQMGPQISARQMDRVLDYIEMGSRRARGWSAAGERDIEGDKANGYFIKPTIFTEVAPTMRIATEEIFGPGALRAAFPRHRGGHTDRQRDELRTGFGGVDARHQAGASRGGGNPRGQRVDQYLQRVRFRLAVRRVKQSGFGRDLGQDALEQYTSTKSVWVAL